MTSAYSTTPIRLVLSQEELSPISPFICVIQNKTDNDKKHRQYDEIRKDARQLSRQNVDADSASYQTDNDPFNYLVLVVHDGLRRGWFSE